MALQTITGDVTNTFGEDAIGVELIIEPSVKIKAGASSGAIVGVTRGVIVAGDGTASTAVETGSYTLSIVSGRVIYRVPMLVGDAGPYDWSEVIDEVEAAPVATLLQQAIAARDAAVTAQAGAETAENNAIAARDTAVLAAAAAGTDIYNSSADLPTGGSLPANGTWGRVQTANGMQAWQVVGGVWTLIGWITRPQFDGVSDLLSDNNATFGGTGIVVQAGPYFYEQAASGATDHHVTTAGGVKLYVVPVNGEICDVSFGVSSSDSTAELAAAIAAVASTGACLVLTKSTTLSGVIGSDTAHAAASLRMRPVGNVVWTLDSGMTAVDHLCRFESTATASFTITGGLGRLTIDCSDKAGAGIWFRHYGARGGVVDLAALKVVNVLGPTGYTSESCGLGIYGDFDTVTIHPDVIVEDVDRLEASGTCAGITVSGTSGSHSDMVLYSPIVRRVLAGPSGSSGVDADGIKLFNKSSGSRRLGSIRIYNPILEDNQGRQIKTQSEDVIIYYPKSRRKSVVTITEGNDFDLQEGGGVIIEPDCQYELNGATTPLGTSFSPFVFAHTVDAKMQSAVRGGVLRTEAQMTRALLTTASSSAGPISSVIDGLEIFHLGSLTGAVFTRAVHEISGMDDVLARAEPTFLATKNVRGPSGVTMLAYTGYTSGGTPEDYLSWEVSGNHNTGPTTTTTPIHPLSGNRVLEFLEFLTRDNLGVQSSFLGTSLTFDFQKLTPGCRFYCDFADNTISNGTGLPASGYGLVEVLDGGSFMVNRTTDRAVRVTPNGTATVYMTHNGGTNWYSNT